jgi:poly(3-hydroxyalkanoate) synthetase
VIYRAAAALPYNNRERATAGLRGQLRLLVSAAGGPERWRATAEKRTGTWWEAWADWVLTRSGEDAPAPTAAGNAHYPTLGPAPGSYVRDRTPPRS